jgi:hypothetical protein
LFAFIENELNKAKIPSTLHGYDDVPDNCVMRALHTLSRGRLHIKRGRR